MSCSVFAIQLKWQWISPSMGEMKQNYILSSISFLYVTYLRSKLFSKI